MVAGLALAWAVLVVAAPAGAAVGTGAEHITSYDVTLTVEDSGALGIREEIDYDFGSAEGKHGIYRTIPVRVPYDNDNDRLYDVGDFRVESPSGAPTGVDHSAHGGNAQFRIGDPDETVSGRQKYVITYTVDGALNAFEDHDELYWNAVGSGWGVPIDRVGVVVRTPADITQQVCFAGPVGSSLPCEALGLGQGPDADVMTAGQPSGLQPYDALTVVVGLPKGAVSATGPHLEERWSLSKAMTPTPVTGTLAGLILIPGLAGVVWLATNRGRDRRGDLERISGTPTKGAAWPTAPRREKKRAFRRH